LRIQHNNFLNAEEAALRIWFGPGDDEEFTTNELQSNIFDRGATEFIKAAAAFIEPCWRERFLASVQDQLLGHEPDRPISDDQVVEAVDGVRWAMFVGTIDDDD
jgi:hypothetical protein